VFFAPLKNSIDTVTVDFVGHLGVDCLNSDNPRAVPVAPGTPNAAGAHRQNNAMLNDEVEELEASNAELRAMVAQQAKAMEVLTTQLKEQAAQIQKVSAQLELSKTAPQMVLNTE
jgi:septal ring factor EnvC (AmiA/AmiB activator)